MMGRKRELETVQLVVYTICSHQKDGITRKSLIEKIKIEKNISERSIAEALSVLSKSGILRKTNEPFRARMRINLLSALKGYRSFQLEDLKETTKKLPERMQKDVYDSFVNINNAVVEGEVDFIKTVIQGPEYWVDYPEEAINWAISMQVHWIMQYLKIWKSKQKIKDKVPSNATKFAESYIDIEQFPYYKL